MCTAYWPLYVPTACPACETTEERELQTHFMGEFGSCMNSYKMGDLITELQHWSGDVVPPLNDMITGCYNENCEADTLIYGFHVDNGRVTAVWPIKWWPKGKMSDSVNVPSDTSNRLKVSAVALPVD